MTPDGLTIAAKTKKAPHSRPAAGSTRSGLRAAAEFRSLFPPRSRPLAWGLHGQFAELLDRLAAIHDNRSAPGMDDFEEWLLTLGERLNETAIGLECLTWAHWVDAAQVSASGLAREFAQLIDDYGTPESDGAPTVDSLLNRQWIQVELPLTLAAISPSLIGTEHLAGARQRLVECLESTIDEGGWKSPDYWRAAPLLLASWVRCGLIAKALRFSLPELSPSVRLCRAAEHWRLARLGDDSLAADQGSAPLNGNAGFSHRDPSRSSSRVAQRQFEQAVTESFAQPTTKSARPKQAVRDGRVTGPRARHEGAAPIGHYSEAGQYGRLQDRHQKSAIRIDVEHERQQLNLRLAAGRSLLIAGCWDQELRIDGEPQHPESEWEHVCWHADNEIEYLELELRMGACRLQRQFVIARHHQFALLADSVTAERAERIDYRARWPLSSGTRFVPERETRNGRFVHADGKFPLLPLSIPEWRADPRSGQLVEVEQRLILEQTVAGPAAFFPLVLDLAPRRVRSQRTWRRLTVAENLLPVPPSEATAFRAESAEEHWLVYRELGLRGNRTFFGKNVCCDFYLGRFLPAKRIYQTLVEIE